MLWVMMQLIVNDTDTAPGISFPFQSITIREKNGKPVTA